MAKARLWWYGGHDKFGNRLCTCFFFFFRTPYKNEVVPLGAPWQAHPVLRGEGVLLFSSTVFLVEPKIGRPDPLGLDGHADGTRSDGPFGRDKEVAQLNIHGCPPVFGTPPKKKRDAGFSLQASKNDHTKGVPTPKTTI